MVEVSEDWSHLIVAEYAKDSWASSIIDGSLHDNRYTVVNDLIIYKGRIFLTPRSKVKNIVLLENVLFVSRTNRTIHILPVYYSHFQFQIGSENVYL